MNQQERNRRISEGLRLAWKRRNKEKAMAAEDNPADDVQPTKEEWDEYERLTAIAKKAEMGLLTDDQAQAAYDAAPAVPLSEERIKEIVDYATQGPEPMTVASHGPEAPKSHDEARFFHDGFLAGVTAYAGAVGHSQLKSDNAVLAKLFDEQGWRTIETYERLSEAVLICEHGVKDGDWCEPCNKEMKTAAREQLEGFDCSAGFCGGLVGDVSESDNAAKPLTCANCGESSTNPGQFIRDGRWICTAQCRRELCDRDSYDDLAASGGIVGAP